MSQVTSQNALVKDSTVQTLNGKLDNLNATLGGNANIAPVYNTATAYSKGDMVNYNGDLYVFTANHSAGAWTGSDAVQTKVSSELSSLKSGLTDVGNTVNKIATSGDIWFPAIFSATSLNGSYFAPLNSLPAHTTATLAEVNELGVGALTLTDFVLGANDEHSLSYIYTDNSAHAGKVCGAKITFT